MLTAVDVFFAFCCCCFVVVVATDAVQQNMCVCMRTDGSGVKTFSCEAREQLYNLVLHTRDRDNGVVNGGDDDDEESRSKRFPHWRWL